MSLVAAFAAVMRAEVALPPIVIRRGVTSECYFLVDGFHRYHASAACEAARAPAQNQFQLTGFGGLLPGLSRSATNKNTRLTADHKAVTQKHTTAMVMIAVPIIPWRLDGPAAAPATRSRPINFHSHG